MLGKKLRSFNRKTFSSFCLSDPGINEEVLSQEIYKVKNRRRPLINFVGALPMKIKSTSVTSNNKFTESFF